MAYKCNKPALKMLSPIFQKMGKNHCSEGPLSMGSPLNHTNTAGSRDHSHNGKSHEELKPKGYVEGQEIKIPESKPNQNSMEGVMNVFGGTASNLYTAGKFLFKNMLSPDLPQNEVKNERYKEKIKNLGDMRFEIPPKSQTITSNNSIHEDNVLSQKDAEGGMSAAERAAYNKETGGDLKGPQKSGPRHDSYCARSAGIPKCKDPDDNGDCPNDAARRDWGC